MINYDPGRWGVWFGLTLYGSVFPKSFCVAAPCAFLCFVFGVIKEIWDITVPENNGANLGTNFLGGFTFILGFLIVFRSQQAYSRWWEGGTLLQQLRGEWFNAFSSLLAFCNSAPEQRERTYTLQQHLVRLFSLLYASALEQVTTIENVELEIIDLKGFTPESLVFLTTCHDRCEVVLQWLQKLIVDANAADTIKIAPPILSRVYNQLGNGIVNLNNARKITEFPIPFPLAQMVAFMLICHWLLTLFVCAAFIDNMVLGTLVCFIVVFSFWSINYISLELEMPFGDDLNDLPLCDMQRDFNLSLVCLLQRESLIPPVFTLEDWSGEVRTRTIDFTSYVKELCDLHEVETGIQTELRVSQTHPRGSTHGISSSCRGDTTQGKRCSYGQALPNTCRTSMLQTITQGKFGFGQAIPSIMDSMAAKEGNTKSQQAVFTTVGLSTLKRLDGRTPTKDSCGSKFTEINIDIASTHVEVKGAPFLAEITEDEPKVPDIEDMHGSRRASPGGEYATRDLFMEDDSMRSRFELGNDVLFADCQESNDVHSVAKSLL